MLIIFVPITILLYFFSNRQSAIVLIFAFWSSFYGIADDSLFLIKPQDCATICIIFILSIELFRNKWIRPANAVVHYILVFFAFIAIISFVGYFVHGDSIADISKGARRFAPLLSIFLFRKIKPSELKIALIWIMFLTGFQSLLYVLQPLLELHLLANPAVSTGGIFGLNRYYNTPQFIIPVLFYGLYMRKTLYNAMIFSLSFMTVVLSGSRGALFSVIEAGIIVRYFTQVTLKKLTKLLLLILTIGLIAVPRLSDKVFENSTSDLHGLMNSLKTGNFELDYSAYENATLSFRFAMLSERIAYLIQNPFELFFGVGFMHEYSENTSKFDFKLGTVCPECPTGNTTIESVDISWLTLFMRIGLLGTILYLAIVFVILKEIRKTFSDPIASMAFASLIFVLISSFGNGDLANPINLSIPLLTLAILQKSHIAEVNIKHVSI